MEKRRHYIIYTLTDPRTKELRYVGKSINGIARARSHTNVWGLKLKDHCHRWLRVLVAEGFQPEIDLHETLNSFEELNEAEKFWIAYFRSIGCRLTNLTDGGEGREGYKFSDESKRLIGEKNSISLLGHIPWNKGKPGCFSDSTIQHWKKIRTGRIQSRETRDKRAKAMTGQKRDASVGRKISAALIGNTANIRAVICLNDGKEFKTIRAASEFYGINRQVISNSCRGLSIASRSGKKFKFR